MQFVTCTVLRTGNKVMDKTAKGRQIIDCTEDCDASEKQRNSELWYSKGNSGEDGL